MSNSSTVTDLESLTGLESAKRVVLRLGRGHAPTHAVLFYGSAGSGKSTLANSLARAWLCKHVESAPCGECQPCVASTRGTAVDIHVISPEGATNLIKLSRITRDETDKDVYPLQEFFRTGPLSGRNKVALIEDIDRMTPRAANALLKTLEEPPRGAKIVMTTRSPGAVLPTIFSRCLAIACSLPPLAPPADLEPELLVSAAGSPGQLKTILDQLEWRREWLAFVKDLRKMDRRDTLRAADRFRALADKGKQDSARLQNSEALEILADLYRGSTFAQEAISEAHRYIAGNGNPGIVIDALFAKLLGEPR